MTDVEPVPAEDMIGRPVVGLGPGAVVGLLGLVGIVVSLFTTWTDPGTTPGEIPIAFLGDNTSDATGASLLLVLIPCAVLTLVGSFLLRGTALRLLAGIVLVAVCAVFAFQLDGLLDHGGLFGALGTGWYFAAVGALATLMSGFAKSMQARLAATET